MSVKVALLRGINVGGHKRVPMADLKKIAEKLGFEKVQTYIQSGNLIFKNSKKETQLEELLEKALLKKFGFEVDVIVRSADEWLKATAKPGFADAAKLRPQLLHAGFAKKSINKNLPKLVELKAVNGEKIKVTNEVLWIDFIQGAGRSKITPVIIDKSAGSPVTLRNWKTVLQIAEIIKEIRG